MYEVMDVQARKKALFRAKLKEHEEGRDKRINSPLVKYNEFDQPVCRVCEIVLKSESFWQAHQVSRKHHEAINNIKANAASQAESKTIKHHKSDILLSERKLESLLELQNIKPKISEPLKGIRPSAGVPTDFFDDPKPNRAWSGKSISALNSDKTLWVSEENGHSCVVDISQENPVPSNQNISLEKGENNGPVMGSDPMGNVVVGRGGFKCNYSTAGTPSESKHVKGPLPEGFFDNKDADLRARGIEPVKPDIKDEYREFEKMIQDDLQDVDNRMEEEEFDAADSIQEADVVEQRACREKVQVLKRKKMELECARSAKLRRAREPVTAESSSDDEDEDDSFIVDWRAKHM